MKGLLLKRKKVNVDDNIKIIDVTILTKDNYLLSALLIEPKNINNLSEYLNIHQIIIGCAVGIKKEYYLDFGIFLAKENFRVLLFDYRGCFSSKHLIHNKYNNNINNLSTDLIHRGKYDIPAVIDYLDNYFLQNLTLYQTISSNDNILDKDYNVKLFFISHSISGMVLAFVPKDYLQKINGGLVTIASQSGYPSHHDRMISFLLYTFVSYILCPIFGPITNNLPIYDLPSDCALQCAKSSRHSKFVFGAFPKETKDFTTSNLNCPVLSYSFKGDVFASSSSVYFLFKKFTYFNKMKDFKINKRDITNLDEDLNILNNLNEFHHQINVKGRTGLKIGHFGFFKKKNELIWKHLLCFLKVNSKNRNNENIRISKL
ncbi:hypothetical protein ABK040_011941 [Willaertia magna]